MYNYTGKTPQDTAAWLNTEFRIVMDQYKMGKVKQENLYKVFLHILDTNLSVYYASAMPNIPKILGDTTGMDNQIRPIFQEAFDKAVRMWMGFPE